MTYTTIVKNAYNDFETLFDRICDEIELGKTVVCKWFTEENRAIKSATIINIVSWEMQSFISDVTSKLEGSPVQVSILATI